MSTARLVKQASYAGGCAAFFLAILGVIVLLAWPRQPAITEATPTPAYKPIAIEEIEVVPHDGAADVVVRLRNSNVRAGVAKLPVTFILTSTAGQEIARREEQSYILPGGIQYVIALNMPAGNSPFTPHVELPSEVTFTELEASINPPTFGSFLRGPLARRQVGSSLIEEQKGIASNEGSYDLNRVEVIALAYDPQKRLVGIGKTFVGELKVGERREFTVQWPALGEPATQIITSLSSNIFLSENIREVIGDPSTLR